MGSIPAIVTALTEPTGLRKRDVVASAPRTEAAPGASADEDEASMAAVIGDEVDIVVEAAPEGICVDTAAVPAAAAYGPEENTITTGNETSLARISEVNLLEFSP